MKTTFKFNDFCNYTGVDDIVEKVYGWNMYERVNLEYIEYEEKVKKHLQSTLKLSDKDINKLYDENIDDIKTDISQACEYALIDDYVDKMFKYIKDDIAESLIKYNPFISKVDFELVENKNTNSGYETVVNITYNKEEFIKELMEQYKYTKRQVEDELYFDDEFELIDVEMKHFDYYGTIGDYDNWFENYKDQEATSFQIKESIKEKQAKLKTLLRNKVNCNYRKILLQS